VKYLLRTPNGWLGFDYVYEHPTTGARFEIETRHIPHRDSVGQFENFTEGGVETWSRAKGSEKNAGVFSSPDPKWSEARIERDRIASGGLPAVHDSVGDEFVVGMHRAALLDTHEERTAA